MSFDRRALLALGAAAAASPPSPRKRVDPLGGLTVIMRWAAWPTRTPRTSRSSW